MLRHIAIQTCKGDIPNNELKYTKAVFKPDSKHMHIYIAACCIHPHSPSHSVKYLGNMSYILFAAVCTPCMERCELDA